MIKAIAYNPAHLDIIEMSADDILRYGELDSQSPHPMGDMGVGFSGVIDGRIVCMGGILQISQHTGICWTIISKYAGNYGLQVPREIKRQLDRMMADMRLHRVETANLVDAHTHHRWCQFMGFENEGVMRYYDDQGRDYYRFAKYRRV
jgi:RimJ/RimL family protein N-acetyltransferase